VANARQVKLISNSSRKDDKLDRKPWRARLSQRYSSPLRESNLPLCSDGRTGA